MRFFLGGFQAESVCLCRMEIITPKEYVGALMELCQARRGDFIDMQFLTETRTTIIYELPLATVSLFLPDATCHKLIYRCFCMHLVSVSNPVCMQSIQQLCI